VALKNGVWRTRFAIPFARLAVLGNKLQLFEKILAYCFYENENCVCCNYIVLSVVQCYSATILIFKVVVFLKLTFSIQRPWQPEKMLATSTFQVRSPAGSLTWLAKSQPCD